MTVQNTNRKDVYLTNGTTVYWPYTFEIFTTDGSDLALYETNLTTGETVLIDTNLTRDIINSRIKYPRTGSPRPAGYKITVARITERTQGIDLETQSFDPKNMERGLDKLTAMVQEIDETVSRAAVADISQQGASFTFPSPVGGKVIGWNAEGTGLINLDNTTLGIEAQMLAATEAAGEAAEAAQTAADKVDNLVSTAFESDGTTVKKATSAGSATLATSWGEAKLIKAGYLNQTNSSDTIALGYTAASGKQLICIVSPGPISFPMSNTSKTLKCIGSDNTLPAIDDPFHIYCYGYINGQNAIIVHNVTANYTYTDGTTEQIIQNFSACYMVIEVNA
jgi:stage V sporulation protein SpoVS